jgi:hypothetical protein
LLTVIAVVSLTASDVNVMKDVVEVLTYVVVDVFRPKKKTKRRLLIEIIREKFIIFRLLSVLVDRSEGYCDDNST